MTNSDEKTIASFGDEWKRFDQSRLPHAEAEQIFEKYFSIFPWQSLPADATGFDMGCGSGRWASLVAPRVGHLHCIDPSSALDRARALLAGIGNVSFHSATSSDRPLPACSQDFGYSLGVLHHIPDTGAALRDCVAMLKPGAPFLVYLYYAFDNRPAWFRLIWRCSELIRSVVCRLPPVAKNLVTDAIAALVYFPLARAAGLLKRLGLKASHVPLAYYSDHSFFTMRTDALDRFGTPLEQRFSREAIRAMMEQAGLVDVRFSEHAPYWCAVGTKA